MSYKIPPWMIPVKEKYREVQIPLYLPLPLPPKQEAPKRERKDAPDGYEVNYEV